MDATGPRVHPPGPAAHLGLRCHLRPVTKVFPFLRRLTVSKKNGPFQQSYTKTGTVQLAV